MIEVRGSARRSFTFPADLPIAYAYYGDVARVLNYLPHICLVRAYAPDRFRMIYDTTELGAYHIRIFADVQTTLEEGWVIRVHPLDGIRPAQSKAGISSSTTQGHFYSESVFYDKGEQTQIEYRLQLQARLPTPLGLRLMPNAMVSRIAKSVTNMRIREITDGFVERSVSAFPHWLAEMENHGSLPERPSPQTLPQPGLEHLQSSLPDQE
jgi:hypothetical protein